MTDQSRRAFLKNSMRFGALLAAAGPLSCGALPTAPAPLPGSKMKFGLVTYLWGKDWDLPTLIASCEKSGVLGVELRTTHAHGVEPTMSAAARIEVRQRFADSNVTLVGPGSNERFDHPDQGALIKAIERTKAFVRLSHDVGGSGVKVKPDSFHKDIPHEKTIEQIGRSLNTLGAFAADMGQEIRLEVHGSCCHLPDIARIMAVADHPAVAVCWNSNSQDLDGDGLEKNFDRVKNRFGATSHIRELNVGDYPYQKLMNLFVGIDYNGWILLEARTAPPDRVQALIEQRALWNEMIARAQAT